MTDNIDNYTELQKLAQKSYDDARWTHKINEKQAELLTSRHNLITISEILLTALTCGGVAALASNIEIPFLKFASIMFSTFSLGITLVEKNYNFDSKSHTYKIYAEKYLELRNLFELLQLKIKTRQGSINELTNEYEKLQKEYNNLCKVSPLTGKKAYILAEKEFKKDSLLSTEGNK